MEKKPTPATLAGRCANGYERGQGGVVHLVMCSEDELRFGINASTAICGKKHGPRSAGWCPRLDLAVTCPKCMKLQSTATSHRGAACGASGGLPGYAGDNNGERK